MQSSSSSHRFRESLPTRQRPQRLVIIPVEFLQRGADCQTGPNPNFWRFSEIGFDERRRTGHFRSGRRSGSHEPAIFCPPAMAPAIVAPIVSTARRIGSASRWA